MDNDSTFPTPATASYVLFTSGDAYRGGEMVNWPDKDVQFTATFAAPEPVSMVLLATGLIGLGAVAWRRRRQGAV
jgi:hypothetical protein